MSLPMSQSRFITLLSLSFGLFFSQASLVNASAAVCLSNDAQPKHCAAGDIIVVRPKEVATSCDFTQQIVRLKPSKEQVEFLCRYTGTILKIKPNTSLPPKSMQPIAPPQKYNNRRKSAFGSMPFFN